MQAEVQVFSERMTILLRQLCEAAEPEYLHCLKPLHVSNEKKEAFASFTILNRLCCTFCIVHNAIENDCFCYKS
jgi:hypothetical protein